MAKHSTRFIRGLAWFFILSRLAQAGVYQINVPNSTYEYLVPPEGPGLSGCQPDDFHCAFGVAGTLEFDINAIAGTGTFLSADLQLSGNAAVAGGLGHQPFIQPDGVESFLVGLGELPLQSTVGGTMLFYQPQTLFNRLQVSVSGNQLLLTGAFDFTPADGAGRSFDLHATEVPEPATGLAIGLLATALTATYRFRRRR